MANNDYKRRNSQPNNNRRENSKGKSAPSKGGYNRKGSKNNWSNNKDKERPASKGIVDAINDISWYAHNPQLLKDSASVAFNQMLGLPMHYGPFDAGATIPMFDKFPGLCVLRTVPSYGSASTGLELNPNSTLNIAAQNVYSFVRHANSGHSNYDPADLMMYIIAMDQAYAFHAELVRAYGCIRFYSGYNRYLGKYLVEALGFDYDDLVSNLAGFRYIINTFAARLCTFAVPAIFPIVDRHRWLCSNIYMDRPSTRAQLYAFVPYYRGVYNEPVSGSGTEYKAGIKARPNTQYKKKLSDVQDMVDEVIAPVLNSEDIGIMSGDILKAYGADKCYVINALPEDYILGPVYIEEVLRQIHNAITIGDPIFPTQDSTSMLVYQEGDSPIIRTWDSSNSYSWVPRTNVANVGPGILNNQVAINNKFLDTNVDSPTPEDVMIMSRLTNIPMAVAGPGSLQVMNFMLGNGPYGSMYAVKQEVFFTSMSADAVCEFNVYNGEYAEDGYPEYYRMYSTAIMIDNSSTSTPADTGKYADALADICKFNWHPIIYEYGMGTSVSSDATISGTDISVRVYADIDNCVLISKEVVNRMHDVALISMLNVPSTVLTRGV